jgi:hypothetical protein
MAAPCPMPTTLGTTGPVNGVVAVVVVVVVVVTVVVVVSVVARGPCETSISTIEPLAVFVSWAGSCETTSPSGFVDAIRETSTLKPRSWSLALAASSVRPTTRGTVTALGATVPGRLDVDPSSRVSRIAAAITPATRRSRRTSHGQSSGLRGGSPATPPVSPVAVSKAWRVDIPASRAV